MSSIRLICFDLGRVLVRICDGWRHACEIAGLAITVSQLDPAGEDRIHRLVCDHEVGRIDFDSFCRQIAPVLHIQPAQVAAMMDVYLLGMYPGAIELIDELHARGYQTACLSNTNTRHWQLMYDPSSPAYLPLDKLTYRFASQLIGHRKPDDAIYAHVEQAAGMRGEQIAFFDDVPENVQAARRRGWHAEQILHDGQPIHQIRQHLRRLRVLE